MPELSISSERPDHPQVTTMLGELDRYLRSLYAPEENHILDVAALLEPSVTFLVARHDDEIVGCGAVRRMPADRPARLPAYGEIKRMFVLPRCRGERIAERLLRALEATVREEGVGVATLETGCDQQPAIRLYERAGYRRRAAFGGYPDNGSSLFYEKALSGR